MAAYDFSLVEAVLVDHQVNTLRLLRDCLMRMGMRDVMPFSSSAGVEKALAGGACDLLVVDAETRSCDMLELVRRLRNAPDSPNPFACVLVTTWQPTSPLMTRATNAGADSVVVKPLSPRQLADRVHALIENRKKFVVTADYVGPDRRRSPRGGTQIPLIEVPNTLRLKATGLWPRVSARELIKAARAEINAERVVRDAFQVPFLVEFALPGLARTPPDPFARDHIARIAGVIDDLRRRGVKGDDTAERVETTCRALAVLADRIGRADRTPAPLDERGQLVRLGHTLLAQLRPDRLAPDLAADVKAAVAAYRARLDAILAAKANAKLASE